MSLILKKRLENKGGSFFLNGSMQFLQFQVKIRRSFWEFLNLSKMMKHGLGSSLLFLQLCSVEYKAFLDMLSWWTPILVGHIINEEIFRNNTSLEELKTAKMSEDLK